MKVKELIEKLSLMPLDAEVVGQGGGDGGCEDIDEVRLVKIEKFVLRWWAGPHQISDKEGAQEAVLIR